MKGIKRVYTSILEGVRVSGLDTSPVDDDGPGGSPIDPMGDGA